MKRLLIIVLFIFFMLVVFLKGAEQFKQIDQWHLEFEPLARLTLSYIDQDNHVVASFFKYGPLLITPRKVLQFTRKGQGPNEYMGIKTAFPYKNNLAIVELADKIKIFAKTNGTYAWKETKWFKRGRFAHPIREGIFFDNKFFLAGWEIFEKKGDSIILYLVKVYDDNGQPLKRLIRKKVDKPGFGYMMQYHLTPYHTDRVLFLQENKLTVYVISAKKLEVPGEVNLEIPSFYKKMPENFYGFKRYNQSSDFLLDLEQWATGYSSISQVFTEDEYLVLQIHTCSDKLKTFALLFYNVENNFKLEKTIFIDDYLLGVKDGKYYCFANGNPGLDDNTDECIIKIYSFKEKNE